MKSVFSVAALAFAAIASATSVSGNRTLVLVDEDGQKAEYSTFLGDLKSRGFDLTYSTAKADSLKLFELGERTYDHIVLLPSHLKNLGSVFTPSALLKFLNTDGNILFALSSTHPVASSVSSLFSELDITLPDERLTTVVDHFSYDATASPETHDVLVLPAPNPIRPDVQPYFSPVDGTDEVLFFPHGTGHILGQSPLLTPILRAPETAYLYAPKTQESGIEPDDIFATGRQLALVSALQARNSARLTVVGSGEMLSDKWIEAKTSGKKVWNREFAKRVSGWTFQETGVLRVNNIEHHLNEADQANPSNPGIYRVKNDVSYSISLSEYNWNSWAPFTIPKNDDLQLEFSMLSPFHRLALKPISSDTDSATFAVNFTVPDQHGIFNFMVNYKRPFMTNIEEKVTVSVRHMAHDEWPRSWEISGAWPWMAGIFTTVTGFIAFSALWMYSKPTNGPAESKKSR
ncbi:Dolichyl-diphosphooligosaccharide--protein glycosyltransferase subunit wbp1 [Ceratocystis lukuohia]|uniref:Dolichyl-diphosphooligosaccharide--protein glycosyltransferase subunit WBP1 n=1 Tax=Ceratocystis lukuohia TaxID=2019550 RepID=A0ABR4MCR8_9PEZI